MQTKPKPQKLVLDEQYSADVHRALNTLEKFLSSSLSYREQVKKKEGELKKRLASDVGNSKFVRVELWIVFSTGEELS
jgi:hypothetical protein